MKHANIIQWQPSGMPVRDREQHLLDFLHAFAYRGERCEECGHAWTENGELHHKHCSSYVSYHSMHKHH